MLWIKAFHIIFIVTWFSGIFYLPRLFVYHAMSSDAISLARFKIMERKLFFGIATPSAILATASGIWLLSYNWLGYLRQPWMQIKLFMVGLLWVYHFCCLKYLLDFKHERNQHGHIFYRWFNEITVIILVVIIIMVVVQPL